MNHKRLPLFCTVLLLGSCLQFSAIAEEDNLTIELIEEISDQDISDQEKSETIVIPQNESEIQTEAESESETQTESEIETETETPSPLTFKEMVTQQLADSNSQHQEGILSEQGLYEIANVQNPDLVLDIVHCTELGQSGKDLQMYESLDVNQQKFYFEQESSSKWSIRSLYSGSYLTGNGDTPSIAYRSKAPQWIIRSAGNDCFYIQVADGRHLTLDASSVYNGALLTIKPFTGDTDQLWILRPAAVSETDFADTDLPNPFAENGVLEDFSLKIVSGLGEDTYPAKKICDGMLLTGEHRYILRSGYFLPFANELAEKYNNAGQPRKFRTTKGKLITLNEGNYGWVLNEEETAEQIADVLTRLVQSPKRMNRIHASDNSIRIAPIWTVEHNAAMTPDAINDIGDSYIEVDIGNQTVWLYSHGEQILETDCVTGIPSIEDSHTPEGVYAIYYMQSPKVLNGPGYSSPVTYWMAFLRGFGLHDATWRTEFGGEIYLNEGSHGCVNLPLEKAEVIYKNASIGFPVVLYY